MEFINVETEIENMGQVNNETVLIRVEPNATEVTENTETEDKTKTYSLTADYKKCTYQIEHWTNDINGKTVTLLVYNYFYWGTFEIVLTDKEKDEILKKDSIILNDYCISCPELDSGCDQYEEIENEESYTEEELLEINSLIYRPIDDEDYDSDEEYSLDTSVLEQNGWSMDDTIYGIDTGCELELISTEEEDDNTEAADENINKEVELFLVEGLQGTSDEGWCFRFTKEFENKDEAYDYYENIKLIPNKDIDWYEERNNGEIGVQQKQLRSVNAKKIDNGIYEYDDDSSPIMTPECVTEDEEEEEEEEEEGDKEEEEEGDKEEEEEGDKEEEEETIKLCINMDCERYPPDWDFDEDTEETYQVGQWQKCNLCDGYFNDDGLGDILYVHEEPNIKEAECSLCGKSEDIVQMKGNGQYLCGNACDEEEDDEEEEEDEAAEEEDKNAFGCDDCYYKGTYCYEQFGLTKEESLIYKKLGGPGRCGDYLGECLPTCLECEAPLYTADDECCGKGRSDEAEPTISHSVAENDVDALAVVN